MILYKYVDLNTALLIIKNSTLKFSKASTLNDPFELTSLHYGTLEQYENQTLKFYAACMSYGILSLTRNPLNPLMWAHYCKGEKFPDERGISLDEDNASHAGIVFGIDMDKAGLNDDVLNVIPAKFGSVIYASTKPSFPFKNSENHNFFEGLQFNFDPSQLEALQRTFLYKPAYWSYEEEVRVVRNISCNREQIQNIDRESIKEAYVGIRNAYNKKYLKTIKAELIESFPECQIYVCGFDIQQWNFVKVTIDEAIRNSFN